MLLSATEGRGRGEPSKDSERRRRLAEVFGDVLPEQTRDDTEAGDQTPDDDWWRAQVPPHHGG